MTRFSGSPFGEYNIAGFEMVKFFYAFFKPLVDDVLAF